jgi:hypothetical protein
VVGRAYLKCQKTVDLRMRGVPTWMEGRRHTGEKCKRRGVGPRAKGRTGTLVLGETKEW